MTGTMLITGASSGIGKAVAEAALDAGWKVGLFARRREPLQAVAAKGEALVLPGDVTDLAAVEGAVAELVAKWGRLDVLFNNAGISAPAGTIDEIPVESWTQSVAVNLTGMFNAARAAFAQMRRQSPQGGRIVNNGSISAYMPRPGSVAYTATKHGVTGLTRTLSLDGRPFNIACGQIDIGNAASDMTERMGKGVPQANGTVKPEPVMDVANVASSVLHMASLPLDANVQFMTVMATTMPYVGRG